MDKPDSMGFGWSDDCFGHTETVWHPIELSSAAPRLVHAAFHNKSWRLKM
jgi:hypothetical protein